MGSLADIFDHDRPGRQTALRQTMRT